MKKLIVLISIMLMLALSACGSFEQTTQVSDKAYLLIIGEPAGNVVTIDDGKPLELEKDTVSFDINGQTATKIEISIGNHSVKITKNGELKAHRKFYVSNGNSFEVRL
ncbi:MAG: hypothetical protein RRB22_08760 [Gammaproteobacteria bacterium]|nr:hypothetical protein [Gammaproteobacteria bacterium]